MLVCLYGFVCYTNQIRATINANSQFKSQLIILNVSHLSRFGGSHFLYSYKILPQILNTVLLQSTNLAFVGFLL